MNKIFTFWEPKEKMPAYIKLCIGTWQKHFPNHEIIICDYENLSSYLEQSVIDKILYKNFTLSIQADSIRVALLKAHGGMWFDADTIITSSNFLPKAINKYFSIQDSSHFNSLSDAEITLSDTFSSHNLTIQIEEKLNTISECSDSYMITPGLRQSPHMAFILAKKNATFLNIWQKANIRRIKIYKIFEKLSLLQRLFPKQWYKCKNWNYLGNAPIWKIIKKLSDSEFQVIQRDNLFAFAEDIFFDRSKISGIDAYVRTYFEERDFHQFLEKTKGIILLHNSWTPKEFVEMDEETFLAQNIMLSKLLKYVLGIK